MMMPFVASAFKDSGGLRTEDVSRICFQLWSAVDHCAKHHVIHRDIKPGEHCVLIAASACLHRHIYRLYCILLSV